MSSRYKVKSPIDSSVHSSFWENHNSPLMVSLPPNSFPLVYLLAHTSCESRVIHSHLAIQQVFIKHSSCAKYFSKHWDIVANREKPHGTDTIMGEANNKWMIIVYIFLLKTFWVQYFLFLYFPSYRQAFFTLLEVQFDFWFFYNIWQVPACPLFSSEMTSTCLKEEMLGEMVKVNAG